MTTALAKLRFRPVAVDPFETVLFYGPKPRLVKMPLSVLREQLSPDARRTANPGLTRWLAAGFGGAIVALMITLALFTLSPTAALILGVMFGPLIGSPLGYWAGPRFYPAALWIVRKDEAGAWLPVDVDPDWPARWTAYFGKLRQVAAETIEAREVDAKASGKPAPEVSSAVDKFIREGPEKPTARFDASSMFELENMDDERADYRSPDAGVSPFVTGSIVGLVALVILSTMLFAIMTSE